MTKKIPAANKRFDNLRKKAEDALSVKDVGGGEPAADVQKLIHELNLHQIELEMQNEALRKSQLEATSEHSKYTDLYDFAPVGYFTFDQKGRIVKANATGASLLGREKRSLTVQPFSRFITPGQFSIFHAHLQSAHESRSKESCKLKLTGKNGTLFDALIDTMAVIDGDGNFDHYRSSVTDITEITRTEENIAHLASFPMLDPNPIAEVDLAGQVYYLNHAAERLLPDLRERGAEHPWLHDWGTVVPALRKKGSEEIVREVNVDGRWCRQTLHLVEGAQRIRIYGMDITESKHAELEMREGKRQLEYAIKELESFSYSVAHDLRAPLRAIDGYARLILKKQGDKFDADTLDKFNVIRSSTHLMGQLIDDLLTFSRLGRKHISPMPLDMEVLVKEAWKEVQASDSERDIKLEEGNMPLGYGDMALIKQVLINLLGNAVKFTKYEDAAHIEVGGYTDGDEHIYYIRDNGVGFDMAYYDKLFGVFQRLHSTEQFEGTGVGLATVQRLIHRHGGRVWAEGKVDHGACFYFALNMKE
jgi:PAS domain S-box-containing protein